MYFIELFGHLASCFDWYLSDYYLRQFFGINMIPKECFIGSKMGQYCYFQTKISWNKVLILKAQELICFSSVFPSSNFCMMYILDVLSYDVYGLADRKFSPQNHHKKGRKKFKKFKIVWEKFQHGAGSICSKFDSTLVCKKTSKFILVLILS